MSILELSPKLLSSGKLADHSLVELMGIAFAHRRSGKILLQHGRTSTTVHVFNGIPVNAMTSSPGQGILDAMVLDHRLTPDDVGQVKKLADEKGMDIERCLRELLEITESQIYYYRQQGVRALIIKACGWRNGFFSFEPGEDFMSEIDMYDLNPLDLIYEGILKYRAATLAAEVHAIEGRSVRLQTSSHEYFLLPGPLYEHSDILDIFTNGIKVSAAVATLQQEFADINLAVTSLYLLLVTGLVVFPPLDEDEVFDAGEIFAAPPAPSPAPKPDPGPTVRVKVVEPVAEAARPEPRKKRPAPEKPASPVKTATPPPAAEESSTYIIARPRKLKKGGVKEPTAPPPPAPAEKPAPSRTPKPAPPREEKPARPAEPVQAPPPPAPAKTPSPPPTPEPKAATRVRSGATPADPQRDMQALIGVIESSSVLYEILGANASTELTDLQRLYAERRRMLLDALAENPPADLRVRAEQALQRLDEAVGKLTDPARRYEYERALLADEVKRAWNMTMKKSLAKKMRERGNWYMLAGSPESARTFYELAIQLDADNPIYYMELGWAIFRHRPTQSEEAASYLANAIQIDPRLDKAYYYLGVIFKRRGNNERAETMFRKSLDLNPEQEPARRELAYLNQHEKQTSLWKKIFGG